MPWAVAAAGVAAVGSIAAGSMQAGAAKDASAQQMQMYQQTRQDLMPYNMAGQGAINQLMQYWGLGGQPGGAGAGAGGQTPGMLAAMQAPPRSGGRKNNSALQDIHQALQAGLPVSDQSWAMAGFAPGGAALGGGPMGGGAPTAASAAGAFDMLKNYPGYQFQYGQGLEALNRNLSAGGRYMSGAMMKDAQTFGQGQAESAVGNYLQMLQYLGTLGQNSAAQVGNFGANAAAGAAGSTTAGGSARASGIAGAAGSLGQLANNQNFQSLFGGGGYTTSGPGYYGAAGSGLPSVYITPPVPGNF